MLQPPSSMYINDCRAACAQLSIFALKPFVFSTSALLGEDAQTIRPCDAFGLRYRAGRTAGFRMAKVAG